MDSETELVYIVGLPFLFFIFLLYSFVSVNLIGMNRMIIAHIKRRYIKNEVVSREEYYYSYVMFTTVMGLQYNEAAS